MKHNRIAIMISALLVLTLTFAGCSKNGGASGSSQAGASTHVVMGSVSTIYMEKDGGEVSTDVTDKETIKKIRAAINGLKSAEAVQAPENEEPYVYLEWDGGDNSMYAFVYQMADGTSLIEVSESNTDEDPQYFTGETVYHELAAIIDGAAKE